ncbi:MAG: ferritin-like domain-containing protein [Parvularculaceae bacterium]
MKSRRRPTARPEKPILLRPAKMKKRRLGGVEGRKTLLHAIAHIEFNAIDLAFDMALRFAPDIRKLGLAADEFVKDWFSVGFDEARHFRMLSKRLDDLGAVYGDLPAHDGLWESAERTCDCVLARLAIVPLVLEARGLDVTPGIAARLRREGDNASAEILDLIWHEEIPHVQAGTRWFKRVCKAKGLSPEQEFLRLVAERFSGGLKPPFNIKAREIAGIPASFYENWNSNANSSPELRV